MKVVPAMTATPPESKEEEKEARSPGYNHRPAALAAQANSAQYYGSDPGYSYHIHYGSAGDVSHGDGGGGYDKNVDYTNGYSSPRDGYVEEEYWPSNCGYQEEPWGGGGGFSGFGGLSGQDLELPIVLGALALGGLATYFLRMAITTKIMGRRRRRWFPSDLGDKDAHTDRSVLQFLWSGKIRIFKRASFLICPLKPCYLYANPFQSVQLPSVHLSNVQVQCPLV